MTGLRGGEGIWFNSEVFTDGRTDRQTDERTDEIAISMSHVAFEDECGRAAKKY